MARVELSNLTKIYRGGVKAVDDVSLSIGEGEFVVLVGPSGCGKSTTLRLIAGLESPEGGAIRIGDRVVNDVPPKDRDIAMVFQNYALYPHMTVYGNMSFALRLRMLPGLFGRIFDLQKTRAVKEEITRRVHRAADLLDIRPLLNRKPRELSGGQRQRVALGRAIVREPAAFLFDEPLSNLDARLRISTRAELKRLHQRLKTTTVYVTHDQEEAMTLGDRVVVMKDGKIQQADSALQTYHDPVNRFVAGFIGMPPMNFFDGFLRMSGDELSFEEATSESSAAKPENSAESNNELTVNSKGFTLLLSHLAHQARARMVQWVNRRVVLGIRPEHFSLEPIMANGVEGKDVSQPIKMRLVIVEPLGNELDLSMNTNLHDSIVARVKAPANEGLPGDVRAGGAMVGGTLSGGALVSGQAMTVYADLRRVHFFEPGETGKNLCLEAASSGRSIGELTHALA